MIAGLCRVLAALAILSAPVAAFAQAVPSAEPGRERERFQEPTVPRARPGGGGVSLPSTVAPPGAEKLRLRIRGVRIVGSTVYSPEELAPL
jgi:hypothetical protein